MSWPSGGSRTLGTKARAEMLLVTLPQQTGKFLQRSPMGSMGLPYSLRGICEDVSTKRQGNDGPWKPAAAMENPELF